MHSEAHKAKSIHRIKIIQGHINSILQMLEEDAYCVDIVHQSMAVQKALKRLDMQVIEDHLNHCVIDQIKDGEENRTVSELLKLYEMK